MKSTQIKDASRNIRRKIVSYLSICLIVMLGVGGFLTTGFIANSMSEQINDFYRKQNFSDFDMVSPLGFSDDDVDMIKDVDGITDAEGVFILSAGLSYGNDRREIQLISITERVSVPRVLSGSMPVHGDECLISEDLNSGMGIEIGDKIGLSIKAEGVDPDILIYDTYTVTGIMRHPEYIRQDNEFPVAVPLDAFSTDVTGGNYLRALVKGDERLDIDAFSDEYFTRAAEIRNSINTLIPKIEDNQVERTKEQAYSVMAGAEDHEPEFIPGVTDIFAYHEELQEKAAREDEMFEEALSEIVSIRSNIIALDRRGNGAYIDANATIGSIKSMGPAFGLLFLVVGAMVCFSTLTIIIDEQKKLVGTTKAFGFHQNEILGKYLLFGSTAAVIGAVLSVVLSMLLSAVGLKAIADTKIYYFGMPDIKITAGSAIAVCAGAVILCSIVTYLSCNDLLSSPASLLMQGDTVRSRRSRERGGISDRTGGNLLNRLILRNMIRDKARVIVSIAIVAGSCILIGMGFTLKSAIDKMPERQLEDVISYDLAVDLGNGVTDKEKEDIIDRIRESGSEAVSASYETHMYKLNGKIEPLYILSTDNEDIDKIFHIRDQKTGKELELPESGVLVQSRMHDNFGYDDGSEITLYDDRLNDYNTEVKGVFQNYYGRMIVTTKDAYAEIFGEEPDSNTIYVTLKGADEHEIENIAGEVTSELTFQSADSFVVKFERLSQMIDIVIIMLIAIAIIMSFLILLNLMNILVNSRKKEIIIMRVNGFRHKEALKYLTNETIFSTLAGLVLGVVVGCAVGAAVVQIVESQDIQFVRDINPMSWVMAVIIESVFAIIIAWISFRKVKTFALREIAE